MPVGEGGEELEKVVQIVRFSVTLLVVKRGRMIVVSGQLPHFVDRVPLVADMGTRKGRGTKVYTVDLLDKKMENYIGNA